MSAARSRYTTRVLALAFAVSGAAGLIYEVVWADLLGLLVGGTTATHTVVLAAFMGGLALGNRFGGVWADRTTRPLRLYARLEAVSGVLAILSPTLATLAGQLYVAIAPGPDSALVFLDLPLRLALAAAAILPGAVAMGGTLPALVRATSERLGDLGSTVGWLYFIHSVGATLGAFGAGFILVPTFGLDLALICAGILYLLLAVLASLLDMAERTASQRPQPPPAAPAEARVYPAPIRRAALQTVFLSGIAAMIVEIVWTRVLALTMGGSAQAFSIMLCTFIGGIAFGGLIAARVARGDRDAFRPLLIAEAVAAGSLILLLPFYDSLPLLFHDAAGTVARERGAYPLYLAMCTATALVAMAVPTLAIGATLPLASRVATPSHDEAGRGVGSTFSVNTVGNVLGAALGGLVLVPLLGLELALRAGAAVLLLAALRLALVPGGKPLLARPALLALGALAVLLVVAPRWNPYLIHSGLYRSLDTDYGSEADFDASTDDVRFLFAEDDAEATVSVVENSIGHRLLRIDGKSDASNRGDVPTQVLVSQLPTFFHEAPKRVLIVGLGSGISVGTLLAHEEIERIDVVEISPAVARASRYFDEWSGAPLSDPRVHLYIRDARSFLRTAPADARWDIIINEPSNPWQPGSAKLFTEEFFALLASRLAPGGVMSQWVQTYEISDDVVQILLTTYASVFPDARVWNPRGNDLVLVASPSGLEPDTDFMAAQLARPAIAREMARVMPDGSHLGLLEFLALEIMGPTRFHANFRGGESLLPHHGDRFPVLQYEAPRAFFVGKRAEFFRHHDARRSERERTDLLIAGWLGDRALPEADLRRLEEMFLARGRMLDGPIARALIGERWERDPDDLDVLRALQRAGDLVFLAETQLWERTLAEGPPADAATCIDWVDYEFRRMASELNVFTRPRFSRYDAASKLCRARFPALSERLIQYTRRLFLHRVEP
ncbi:MAG: fused MFS/spermidine synthase [Deltaproteobacteria bacterium]|nr:fused MFS/spermidine synthase [Deltaproteobacteria bacterium]MCB9788681.1 fused MFS/spermidine synthase [Deltaproteobacteria bacterium]